MAGLVDSGGGGSYSGFDLGGGSSGQSRLEEVIQREIDFFTNTDQGQQIVTNTQTVWYSAKMAKGATRMHQGLMVMLAPEPTPVCEVIGFGIMVYGALQYISAAIKLFGE